MSDRPTSNVASALERMIRALGRRVSNGRPDQLRHLSSLERVVEEAWTEAVEGLRSHGHTDGEIAAELGITRQAVSKRWPGGGRYIGAAGRYRRI